MKPKLGELILAKKKIMSAFRFGHDDMVSTELDKLHSEDWNCVISAQANQSAKDDQIHITKYSCII